MPDWILRQVLPDQYTLPGAAIIIASGVYLIRREAVHAQCEYPWAGPNPGGRYLAG